MQTTEKKRSTLAQAYCFGCRTKVKMKNTKNVTLKSNRPAIEGKCSICGTRMFKIVKKK